MKKDWKKTLARDTLILGGIPFYVIALIRSFIGNYMLYVYQLIIAGIILIIISRFVKENEMYTARSLVLLIFTSLFYKEFLFTIGVSIMWIALVYAAYYLKFKKTIIAKGFLTGIICVGISYYLSPIIASLIG